MAPLQITHVAQFPAATVGFDTASGVSLGSAVDAIRDTAVRIKLPASVTLSFLGAANAYEASLANELWLILAAIVCVYIVLGVLYESFVHPRSEEHTSELQSLMRISYAVFCFKK